MGLENFDPTGLGALGKASEKIVDAGIEGVKTFLSLTCAPLLEEIGLMGRDKFSSWRLNNVIGMLEKAQGKLAWDPEKEKLVIDPRVAFQIVEHASTVSNETLQDMWAGLFASSCHTYEEDENIFFIDLLKGLTSSQVKLIAHLCKISPKTVNYRKFEESKAEGVVFMQEIRLNYQEISTIMQSNLRLKVDSELDTLESIGLILRPRLAPNTSPLSQLTKAQSGSLMSPSLKALRLFVKCQGSNQTPFEFFLNDVKGHYYRLLKNHVEISENDALNYVIRESQLGAIYKDDIEWNAKWTLKNPNWLDLTNADLTERLKKYLIYHRIEGLENKYIIVYKGVDIGEFQFDKGYNHI
jgi:hypothetical protein